MKSFFISLLLMFVSCVESGPFSKEEEIFKNVINADHKLFFINNLIVKEQNVLLFPLQGCKGCETKAMELFNSNVSDSNFTFIFHQAELEDLYKLSKRVVIRNRNDQDLIFMDSYPVLLRFKNNKLVNYEELNPAFFSKIVLN